MANRPLGRFCEVGSLWGHFDGEPGDEVRGHLIGKQAHRLSVLVPARPPGVVPGRHSHVRVPELPGHVGEGDPGTHELRAEGVAEILVPAVPDGGAFHDPRPLAAMEAAAQDVGLSRGLRAQPVEGVQRAPEPAGEGDAPSAPALRRAGLPPRVSAPR